MSVTDTDFCLTLPKNCKIIEKTAYALPMRELNKLKKSLKNKDVYVCGVDYCCCVLAICFQLFDAGIPVNVVWDAVEACSNRAASKDEMKVIYERNFGADAILCIEDLEK